MAESISHNTYYRDWGKYNDDLAKRGEFLSDLSWIAEWDAELERMNAGKRGRPYEYPDLLFEYCAKQMYCRCMPYRLMEGCLRAVLKAFGRKAPDHSTIEERCLHLDWTREPPAYPQRARIAVDSTGISTTVRGEWLREKYHVERGFVKLHIAADVDTDEILAYAVTDGGYPDGYLLLTLTDHVIGLGYEVEDAFADASYDWKDIWVGLTARKIRPVVNLRASDVHANGCLYKGQMIKERDRLGPKEWKKSVGYGTRWKVECTFSDFKRCVGSAVRSRKISRISDEIACKVWVFNKFKKFRGQ